MADTWKDYPIYPRNCSVCGGRVNLKDATFSAKVRKGKVVEARSVCGTCRALASQVKRRCVYCGRETRRQAGVCAEHADLEAVA